MTSREQLPKNPPLFPLGRYTSRTAVSEFFPDGPISQRRERSALAFLKEDDVLALHYVQTRNFSLVMPEWVSEQTAWDKYVRIGMYFLHRAARIEANTKKFQLPKIEHGQLVHYLAGITLPSSKKNVVLSIAAYDKILADFKRKEETLQKALPGFLKEQEGLLVGAAFMRDFLITAPTLSLKLSQ